MSSRLKPDLVDLPPPPPGKSGWPWTQASVKKIPNQPDEKYCPKISLITPSFNQVDFIEQTIRSVLLQDYPNLEFIIIDGNSTDHSQEIIRKYDKWLDFWVSEPDRGQTHAINKGADRVSGEISGWLNSDDFLLPGALHTIARLHSEHPKSMAWIGGCYRIRPDGLILSCVIPRNLDRASLADWWWQGFFFQPSCFFSATAWKELGYLDESLYISFDIDWWLRLIALGPFSSTNEMISAATIHPQAKTQASKMRMRTELSVVQMRYGYPDYQKKSNHWSVRFFKSRLVRRRILWSLGEIITSRIHRYFPYNKGKYPRNIETVLSNNYH